MKKIITISIFALFLLQVIHAQTNNSRGVKREKEECEELAMQAGVNPRASGSGSSSNEAIALNLAKLQARNELAAQVTAEITSIIKSRTEQYSQTAGAGSSFNVRGDNYQGNVESSGNNTPRTVSGVLQRDSMAIAQYVSQVLTNTRTIAQNTYDQPDGTVLVYVCMEMGLPEQRQAYNVLKNDGLLNDPNVSNNDGKNNADMSEDEFLIELAKVREEYAQKAREE